MGACRMCARPSSDTDICDRCDAWMDAQEDRPRRQRVPVSTGSMPYEPGEPW